MDNTELNYLNAHARRMAHMAPSGSMQCVPQLRAPWASIVITSIAIVVAVLTVLVSAPAVRAGTNRNARPRCFAQTYGPGGQYSSKVQQRPHYLMRSDSSIWVPASANKATNGYCVEFGTKC